MRRSRWTIGRDSDTGGDRGTGEDAGGPRRGRLDEPVEREYAGPGHRLGEARTGTGGQPPDRPAGSAAQKSRPGRSSLSVLKPPLVGEARSLRRAGDRSLRNSANYPRNFGRRGPRRERPAGGHHSGPSDCLPQTQVPAKSQDAV